MPWGRILLAVSVTALLLLAFAGLFAAAKMDVASIGLSSADRVSLEKPFDDLVAGRDGDILSALVPGGDPAQVQAGIDQLQGLLPEEETPSASRMVNWRVTAGTGGNWLTAVAEHEFRDHIARSETILTRASTEQPWLLHTLNVNVAARSEIPDNSISFAGRPPIYIAIVVAAFVLPFFMLATFWAVLFWPGLKPRWVWAIMAILGFGQLSLNCTTGDIGAHLLSFNVFGASAFTTGSAFDPWIISVAAPLGAIAFWLSRPFAPRAET